MTAIWKAFVDEQLYDHCKVFATTFTSLNQRRHEVRDLGDSHPEHEPLKTNAAAQVKP